MLLNFLYLFTAIFGFIIIYLMGFTFKSKATTNVYLIIFFFLSSIRFFLYGITPPTILNQNVIYSDVLFHCTSWPCLYLYFNNLVNNKNSIRLKELVHFIIPLVLFFGFCIKSVLVSDTVALTKTAFFTVILLNAFYFYGSYKLLLNKVWKRESKVLLINSQFILLKKWTKFLFFLLVLMFLRVLFNLVLNDSTFWYYNHNYYLWIGALLWIILFIKIATAPDLLYGYNILQSKIKGYDKNTIAFDNVWKIESSKTLMNVQDTILKERLGNTMQYYIMEIERISLYTDLFFSIDFTIVDLATKLNIPKSHLFYVFKYHSELSFLDFKKMIRIQRAIALIGEGYLKTNTMEALATDVGFSSYSPFFKSFKIITGESPYEYQKAKDTVPKISASTKLATDYGYIS
jgi:AraC-like DNA-binding protein